MYYVWANDGIDRGADISAWPNVVRLGIVDETDEERTFNLATQEYPTGQYAARAFLATTSNFYDYFVEGLKSAGTAASTATCYIDTGFCPVGNKTICTVDCKMNSTTYQQYIFGCNDGSTLSFCGYENGSGKYAFACNNGGGAWKMATDLSVSTATRVIVTLDGTPSSETGRVTVKSTGTTYTKTYSGKHTSTSAVPMCLFAKRNSASSVGNQALVTIYSCVITNNGARVREYRPAMMRGVAGMWESVEKKFCVSAGTDAFSSVGPTNTNYFVEEGDVAVAASPVWTLASSDYVTDLLQVEPLSLTFQSGGTKRGVAPLVFTGVNNWGGTFTVYEGSLIADFGQGLATTDALVLDGGNYGPLAGENVGWTPGAAAAGAVTVAPGAQSFGFTAYGHPLTVVADESPLSMLEFGTASSCGLDSSSIVLNDDWATGTLTFRNGIAGNNGDGTVPELVVYTGAAEAVIEGGITNISLSKEGSGTLRIHSATNTLDVLRPRQGALVFAPPDGVATGVTTMTTLSKATNFVSSVVFSNSTVRIAGSAGWWGGTDVQFVNSTASVAGNMTAGSNAGSGGKSGLLLDGSSLAVSGDYFTYGYNLDNSAKGTGDIVLTNSSTMTCKQLRGRNGSMRQYGGTLTVSGEDKDKHQSFFLGSGGVGYHALPAATYELHGGTINVTKSSSYFVLGENNSLYYGDGTLYVYSGGTVNFAGDRAYIGRYSQDKGRLYIRGGSVAMSKSGVTMYVSSPTSEKKGSLGEFEVSGGGVLDVNGIITAGSASSGGSNTARLWVLTNGVVKARRFSSAMTVSTDTSTIVFDGGTIFAKPSAYAKFIYGFTYARVGVGGGTIDTNGQNLDAPQPFAARTGQAWPFGDTPAEITAAPAFTKAGEGVLTLTGTNNWLCGTCVSNGTLAVAEKSLPATNLRLAGGVIDLCGFTHTVTNLVGSGTITNGTLVVAGKVWPGYGDNGELVVAAGATLSATNLSYSVDSASGASGTLVVKGPFDLSGVTIAIENAEATGPRGLVLVKGSPVSGMPSTEGDLSVSVSASSVKFKTPGMVLTVY